jgi:hypothetical protein
LIERRKQLLFFAMLLVAVVMRETGVDVITQTVVVPMPMLYLNGGCRPSTANRFGNPNGS